MTPPASYSSRVRREVGCTYTRVWSRPRHCSISRHQQSPLDDTSLSSLKRRSQSISTCLQRFRTQRLETVRVVRGRERKKTLAKMLRNRYGVKFSVWEINRLSEEQMTRRAVEKHGWKLAQAAGRQMVRWFYRQRLCHGIHEVAVREHMAAFLIQLYWRRYQVPST